MTTKDELEQDITRLERRVKFLEKAIAKEHNEIETLISDALPDEFPLYPDDWPSSPGFPTRCVGEHTPVTLVMTIVDRYKLMLDYATGFRQVYYRPIYDKDGRVHTAFWYDRLTWKEPMDEFGKQLFVQEL